MKQIKQISIWLIALVGLMTVTNAVQADDYSFKYNGLYYKITASGPLPLRHYVKVVPEKAGYPYYSDANKPKGAVVVPEKFTRKVGIGPLSPSHTYIVTEIGEYAFYGCKGLTSVSIPTVQVIGNEAFRECSWMTSVRISGNALRKIGDAAFAGC
ncbi:leucine-rich repeat domain-containing protein, partial [Tannerella forsythia]